MAPFKPHLQLEVKVLICDELHQKYRRCWASFLGRVDDENKLFPLSIMTENVRSPVYEAASSEL